MRQTDMRHHLLTTGLRVLHARGFNGCGVQEITDEAQVPKGSFYNHFESKELFGAEVLGRYWEERASRALALLSDESRAPLDRLKTYFDEKTIGRTQRPQAGPASDATQSPERTAKRAAHFAKGCMIGNFSAELAGQSRLVRDRLRTVFAGWTSLLATCIQEAQADGSLSADTDPETLAAFLIDAFEGAVLRTKVDQDPKALLRFREIAFTKLLV
jgi:TetR/AcrR family transcriptional regulator, transcriptional repressor for nem operon